MPSGNQWVPATCTHSVLPARTGLCCRGVGKYLLQCVRQKGPSSSSQALSVFRQESCGLNYKNHKLQIETPYDKYQWNSTFTSVAGVWGRQTSLGVKEDFLEEVRLKLGFPGKMDCIFLCVCMCTGKNACFLDIDPVILQGCLIFHLSGFSITKSSSYLQSFVYLSFWLFVKISH